MVSWSVEWERVFDSTPYASQLIASVAFYMYPEKERETEREREREREGGGLVIDTMLDV